MENDGNYTDDCFGRYYDARVRYCKICEVAGECKERMLENKKKIIPTMEENAEIIGSPYRQNTSAHICYEQMKEGGTFESLIATISEILEKKKIKCNNIQSRLNKVILGCKKGFIHTGAKFEYNNLTKVYKIYEERTK